MKKLTVFKYLIIHFVLILSFACQNKKSPKDIFYFRNSCKNVDSIWNFYEQHRSNIHPSFISHVEQRMFFAGKQDETRKLLLKSSLFLNKNKDEKFTIYHRLNEAYYFLWKQKFDSCALKIKSLNLNHVDDTSFVLAKHQLIGSYWYLMNELDSSNAHFKRGYFYALSMKREDYIQTFALNLGALAYSQNLIGTAIYYFSKAYQLNLKNHSPNFMLNNNLAAALLTQKKYKEAEKLLLLDTINLNSRNTEYYGITAKLNFVCLKQEQNLWNDAALIINKLQDSLIPKSLFNNWLYLKMRQLSHDNPSLAKQFFVKNQSIILSNLDYFLFKIGDELVHQVKQYPESYTSLLGAKQVSQSNIVSMNFRSQFSYFQILSEFEKLKGNYLAASNFERTASLALKKDYFISDSLKIEDISINMSLIQLSMKLEESEQSLMIKSQQLAKSWFGILLLLAIMILFISLGYYILKKKSQHAKMSQELLESKSREALYLEEEKRLNSKIHAMSKVIIQKSKSMAESIKRGPYFNSPEIKSIQKELENMGRIEALVNSEDKVQVLERDFEYLWSKYKILEGLNESQKRILVLSIEHFKPKEIAMSLNLSYPYVRNVQTYLRKLLLELNLKDFSDLKN